MYICVSIVLCIFCVLFPHLFYFISLRSYFYNSQTQPTPTLRDNNKKINERKKKKKTRRSMSNKKFRVFHCCKKRGHTIDSFWYANTCSHCRNKGHCEETCWKKQAMFIGLIVFIMLNGKKYSPINNIHKGTWRGVCQEILVEAT
jgi:hypothetical protein